MADLAHKTRRLVQASARQEGLGRLTAGVTFDTGTVQTLRETPGSYEAKVFNLVRGLRQEIHTSPDTAPVLRPIRDRAERVLTELETRQTSGDDAMDQIEKLVREREDTLRAAQHSGLSMMGIRLIEMRRLLKPTGSIYLHCDPTASHYLKILMDAVFGLQRFRNEIVWKRFNFHADARRFGVISGVFGVSCG